MNTYVIFEINPGYLAYVKHFHLHGEKTEKEITDKAERFIEYYLQEKEVGL